MCSIFGYYVIKDLDKAGRILKKVIGKEFFELNRQRGRDGVGFIQYHGDHTLYKNLSTKWEDQDFSYVEGGFCGIGNFRAIPTNEWDGERRLCDQQPFLYGDWASVHNGTVYNDKEIFSELDITDKPTEVDSFAIPVCMANGCPEKLKGGISSANFNYEDNSLFLMKTYLPFYLYILEGCTYLFSSMPCEEMLNKMGINYQVIDFKPYTNLYINGEEAKEYEVPSGNEDSAIVCFSGGLDSTTAATVACQNHKKVILANFNYGCKANDAEIKACQNIHKYLQEKFPEKEISLEFIDLSFLTKIGGSTLIDNREGIGVGKAAVEYAIDWVPARNTAFMGCLASYCDKFHIGNIYAGFNLEESGAYEDNSEDFYRYFEKVLKTGTKARPSIVMPVGQLMKHEIVKLALEIGAPIHLSWSCYHDGDRPCGKCGPCFLRKRAFAINGKEDMLDYIYKGTDYVTE